MLQLKPNEQIIIALHRHWIVILGQVMGVVVLLFLPFLLFLLLNGFAKNLISEDFYFLISFVAIIYFLIVYLILFIIWMDHYLDMWIVTDERIIDIEHFGIFRREVSEFSIKNVQDVSIEIPGMIATFLKYGNVIVQTAGEKSFTVYQIPKPELVKDLIIEYSKRN